MIKYLWSRFREGVLDGLAISSIICPILFIVLWVTVEDSPPYHITCYSPDLAITYMSIEPVYMANEYGVWKFASGKGAYIQQSGDTCVTDEVVENIPQGAP